MQAYLPTVKTLNDVKRYRDFTCLWEKVPNGLLYDWLKFLEENHARWSSFLRQLTDGEKSQEWQTLTQEASQKFGLCGLIPTGPEL